MAYTKQTWADLPSKTTPINATRLTHIEDGIFNAAQTADTAASTAGTAAANVGIVSGRVETLTERVNGLDTAVSNKVDKVTGKGLSTNDYDNTDKGKVDALGTASTKNSTSVVTQSTDLVESGAVYDALGWGNKNLAKPKLGYYTSITEFKLMPATNGCTYIAKVKHNTSYKVSKSAVGDRFVIALFDSYPNETSGDPNAREVVNNNTLTEYEVNSGSLNYICFTANRNESVTDADIQAMIEEGTSKTTYEPYHESVSDSLAEKCDNSVIGTVEDGATASQAYAVGSHFIRNGAFCTVTSAISANESLVGSSKFTSGDVADDLNVAYSSVDSLTIGTISVNSLVKIGKIINLNIRLSGVTVSAYTEFGNIPSVFRPKDSEIEAIGNVGGEPALFVIKSNGKLISRTAVTNSNIFLNAFYICN